MVSDMALISMCAIAFSYIAFIVPKAFNQTPFGKIAGGAIFAISTTLTYLVFTQEDMQITAFFFVATGVFILIKKIAEAFEITMKLVDVWTV